MYGCKYMVNVTYGISFEHLLTIGHNTGQEYENVISQGLETDLVVAMFVPLPPLTPDEEKYVSAHTSVKHQ